MRVRRWLAAVLVLFTAVCGARPADPDLGGQLPSSTPLARCVEPWAHKARSLLQHQQTRSEHVEKSMPMALVLMGQHDQEIRRILRAAKQACGSKLGAEDEFALMKVMRAVDTENQGALKQVLTAYGWPTSSRWGAEVANAAFLILQHADQDPALQAKGMALLEPMVRTGDVAADEFALLFDRIRVNGGQAQRYGTQGRCQGRLWKPLRLEDPDAVDALRAAVGLSPLGEYASVASQLGCQH